MSTTLDKKEHGVEAEVGDGAKEDGGEGQTTIVKGPWEEEDTSADKGLHEKEKDLTRGSGTRGDGRSGRRDRDGGTIGACHPTKKGGGFISRAWKGETICRTTTRGGDQRSPT